MEYLSSIVFHTVILKMLDEKGTKARNVASFLYSGKMEYLSQHSHSRTAVRNSCREVDMYVHVVLYLRACTYRYRCLIFKDLCITDPDFP